MFKKVVVKNQPVSYSAVGRMLLIGIAMLTLSQSVGCNLGLRETAMVTYRDMVWAKRAYNLRYGNCDRAYSDHFQNGFCAGYEAVAQGGDGYVPALPPGEYRSYEFQSADGAKCVNSWFEGYPAGVTAARKDKAGTYHDVLISRMINSAVQQEKTEQVLPVDVPIVSARQAMRSPLPSMAPQSRTNMMPSVLQQGSGYSVPPQAQMPAPTLPQIVPGDRMRMELPRIIQADYSTSLESASAAPVAPTMPTVMTAAPMSNTPLPMATVPASWNSTRRSQ